MKYRILHILIVALTSTSLFCQDKIDIKATFNVEFDQIQIHQFISYKNASNDTLKTIYLNDWSNSYSTKTTPLAERFSEEYDGKFHFAKSEERGFTTVTSMANSSNASLDFERLKEHPDVIKVTLENPLFPNQSYEITLEYIVKIPSTKFTDYGVTALKDYNLKYWYITPTIYNGSWNYYSNKNLDDLFVPKTNITMQVEFPRNYVLTSELDLVNTTQNNNSQTALLKGNNRIDSRLFLQKLPVYRTIQTDKFAIVSNYTEKGLELSKKAIITDKIIGFITRHLGPYPHKKLIVSNIDTKKDPVYGLNQLPDFIRPFPKNFQFELQLLKNTLGNYWDQSKKMSLLHLKCSLTKLITQMISTKTLCSTFFLV